MPRRVHPAYKAFRGSALWAGLNQIRYAQTALPESPQSTILATHIVAIFRTV